jgi:hypothetical protein
MASRDDGMNASVELNLALILFLPWYVLLGWLFWRVAARGGTAGRKLLAIFVLGISLGAAAISGLWAYGFADAAAGAIWRQVFACVVGYGAFLAVLGSGFIVIRTWSGTRPATSHTRVA